VDGRNCTFGYDHVAGELIVNEAEAVTVRQIFQRYVELKVSRRCRTTSETQLPRTQKAEVRFALLHQFSQRVNSLEATPSDHCWDFQASESSTFMCHLGADAKQANGTAPVTFSIAVSSYWNNDAGERQTRTDWQNIVVSAISASTPPNRRRATVCVSRPRHGTTTTSARLGPRP
jgi:hypothetical protein